MPDHLPLPLSTLALGTMGFGETIDARDAARMVSLAIDSGITVIDTANVYADGEAERILAPLLRPIRESVIVATKVGLPHADTGDVAPLSGEGVRRAVRGSRERLDLDHIDILYLHVPDRSSTFHDTVQAVGELIQAGTIAAFGVSNHAAWQIAAIIQACDDLGVGRPVVAQQMYNLVARRLEDEYAEFAIWAGLHTTVYNPLAGGMLSGRHLAGARPSGRFADSKLAGAYRDRYWNDAVLHVAQELADLARSTGLTPTELAIRWLLGRSEADSILLGSSKVEHLTANIASGSRGPLPHDVAAAATAMTQPLLGSMPAYNR